MKINGKIMRRLVGENQTISFDGKIIDIDRLKNSKIVVAFSGGRDSVALLHYLYRMRESYNIKLYACHVNHGIRGEMGDRDEDFCKSFCMEFKIPLFIKKIDVPSHVSRFNLSVEDAARKLRYLALFEVLQELGADYIATAHHLDDIVETFFVKVFTGGAIYNLKGFDRNDRVLRPFANLERMQIEEYIKHNKLEYVDDETNFSSDYVRNWVRLKIIPEIRNYNRGYLNNIYSLQEQSSELKNFLHNHLADSPMKFDRSLAHLDKKYLLSKSLFERRFLLAKMFEKFFRVEKKHIDNAMNLLVGKSKRINMPDGFIFEVSMNKVIIFHRDLIEKFIFLKKESDDIVFLPKLCKYIKFDGSLRDAVLIIRNRKDGDRVDGSKLKDILIEKKIDKFDRDRLVVVEKDGKIIWVENVWEVNENIKAVDMEV
ncbi:MULTISPECIES: tRNA lysidine(34) synthetase TilS [Calditerrivibrio]|uniref:tRNA(Ile)-lysidine synthase n=1 Tax=Calditerrivibrio nitroreducens TaxID=477976 RepID=A0A2J6WHU7_9BACT|nr:MAG: tRNA lysidine(34) synthetase TilS [Calditerrivibrio nitroreducens]